MNQNRKIIILEDDLFYGKIIMNFLLNQEYKNVQLFQDEAECLKAVDNTPTLFIIDHHLKNSVGLDIIAQIKEINENAQFIYLSSQNKSSIAIKALKAGAVDYIEKNNDAFFELKKSIDEHVY